MRIVCDIDNGYPVVSVIRNSRTNDQHEVGSALMTRDEALKVWEELLPRERRVVEAAVTRDDVSNYSLIYEIGQIFKALGRIRDL